MMTVSQTQLRESAGTQLQDPLDAGSTASDRQPASLVGEAQPAAPTEPVADEAQEVPFGDLVARVKDRQRRSAAWCAAWHDHCELHSDCFRDPLGHEAASFTHFPCVFGTDRP